MTKTKKILGSVPVNRGEYSSENLYYKNNMVQYNGCCYVCTSGNKENPTRGVVPTNTSKWKHFSGMPIVQESGNSDTCVMSQKAVTELTAKKFSLWFTQKGYWTKSGLFVNNTEAQSTDFLRIGSKIVGRMYLDNNIYNISFYDENKNFISCYIPEENKIQYFVIEKEIMPSNAVYFTVSTIVEHSDTFFLFFNNAYEYIYELDKNKHDIEEIKTDLENTFQPKIVIPTIDGYVTQSGKIVTIVENVGKMTDYIPVYTGMVLNGFYDGGTAYPNYRAFSFFDENKSYISGIHYDTAGYKSIVLTKDNIPDNAKYIIASTLLTGVDKASITYTLLGEVYYNASNTTALDIANRAIDSINNINEKINGEVSENTFKNASSIVQLGIRPVNKEEYIFSFSVTGDLPTTDYKLYKRSEFSTGDLILLKSVDANAEYPITKDAANPYLYLFKTGFTATGGDVIAKTKSTDDVNSRISALEKTNKNSYISNYNGINIVCFGDSITQFEDAHNKSYADYIAELTKANVINVGIGGTQLRQREQPVDNPAEYQAYAAFDIINMVKASCDRDFSKQDAAVAVLPQYSSIIERLKNINWNNVSAVTFFAGTNDWYNSGSFLGETESSDINTTLGAINEIIHLLLTTYPHMQIYWFTPIVRYTGTDQNNWDDSLSSDNSVNSEGITLKQFSKAIQDEVTLNHIPVCDMYNTLGWNKFNFTKYFLTTDSVHPYKGFEYLARKIIAFIEANKTF